MSSTARVNQYAPLSTPALAVSAFAGMWGLGTMIELGDWLRTAGLIVALTATAVAITRATAVSRWLPTGIGIVASTVLVVGFFALDENGGRYFLPSPGAFTALWDTWVRAVDYAATTVAPAEMTHDLLALLTTGLLLLFLVTDLIAVTLRSPAAAGVLLMLAWMPSVILQQRISTTALIVAIAAWLAAVTLLRKPAGVERGPTLTTATAATVASVLLVLVVAPSALGGNGWGMIPRIDAPESFNSTTRLNLDLDLRTSLNANSNSPVLVYSTTSRKPDVLRQYTFREFDGTAWSHEKKAVEGLPANETLLWPLPGVAVNEDEQRQFIEVQALGLNDRNLPIPVTPAFVNVPQGWFYDPDLDEVRTEELSTRDLSYTIATIPNYLEEAQLRASQELVDAGQDLGDPRYVEIAPAIDLGTVQTVTADVVGDAQGRYEQAIAIQDFLRNPQNFRYDTTVSPSGTDSVSTFLTDRVGYCVQFATAMVVMARALDIPARLSIGFLGGRSTGGDGYVVRGGDAHAWPELYFPGQGWVRFEPTPSTQTGQPPQYADVSDVAVPVPDDVINGAENGQTPGEVDAPEPGTEEVVDGPEVTAAPGTPVWVLAAAGVAVLLVVIVGWLWNRRRQLAARLHSGPEGAWLTLRERVPEQYRWPLTLTPHEVVEHVERTVNVDPERDRPLSQQAARGLTSLAHAVSDHRYAPRGTSVDESDLVAWTQDVVEDLSMTSAGAAQARKRAKV
jgi:transglutaminase-like putative cysteine protease